MIVKVKISVRKLKKLDDPEARLRRAVLINNTLLCLRRGDEAEKGKRERGKEVLPPSNEYRTSLEKALPGGGGPCWSRGDERGQWTEEKGEWKMEEQLREEEQMGEEEHLKEEEHFRGEVQLGEEEQMEDEVKVGEEDFSNEAEERLRGPDCDNGGEADMQHEHGGGSERLHEKDGMVDESEEELEEGRTKSSFNRLSLPACHCQYYLPSLSPTFYGLQLSRLVCSMES